MKYYLVEIKSRSEYPFECNVVRGPFEHYKDVVKAFEDEAYLYRAEPDVHVDHDEHEILMDEGKFYRTILIAEGIPDDEGND